MQEELRKLIDEEREEGRVDGLKEGETVGIVKLLKKYMEKGNKTLDEALKYFDLPLKDKEKYLNVITSL